VYGVIEKDIEIEYIISRFTTKPPKQSVKIILKIGIYMLKYFDGIPDYAAINNVVELTKSTGKKELAGFVNATLKNIASKDIIYPSDREAFLSVKYSFPPWAVKKLIKQYGDKFTEELIGWKLIEKEHIRLNLNKTTERQFETILRQNNQKFIKSEGNLGYYITHSTLKNSNIDKSIYTNQSASSILVCRALEVKNKSKVLDACAAPGGKSVLLSEINKEGLITAWDIHPHRVELIKAYAKRMDATNINAELKDASILHKEHIEGYDYVLCDVPCSGFGVVFSKPDIKIGKAERDIEELSRLQYKILDTCSNYVKRGGFLMYSTCTIFEDENNFVADKFLENNKNFEARNIKLLIDNKYKQKKYIQLLPNTDNAEGFFMAMFKRKD
jgi:16S rRNA (cytosine967-C5)-methyltransferase